MVEAADDRVLSGLDHVQLLRDQEELVEIAAARERLRDGHYGLCSKCGKPIPLGRLRVLPTARLCLEHQAEWERTHPAAPSVHGLTRAAAIRVGEVGHGHAAT